MNHRQTVNVTTRWDAGEIGCGRLIVELRQQLGQIEAGESLEVTARGEGAPIDIPVWCGMTGNRLIAEAHPVYVIQRKAE